MINIKFPFKDHFRNRLYVYFCLLFGLPLVTCLILNFTTAPKNYEKFSIFIGAELTDRAKVKGDISNLLSEDLLTTVESESEVDSDQFNTMLSTYGKSSDVVILSKTIMDAIEELPYFSISNDNPYYAESNLTKFSSYRVGILLNEKTNSYLSTIADLKQENYYALVSNKSVHAKGFSDDFMTDQVERVLNLFLN